MRMLLANYGRIGLTNPSSRYLLPPARMAHAFEYIAAQLGEINRKLNRLTRR